MALLFLVAPAIAQGATLTTGKADYAPSQVVDFHGTGFAPGDYAMPVLRPDGSIVVYDAVTHTATPGYQTTTVGADGILRYDYQLNGIEGAYVGRAYAAPWSGDWNETPVAEVHFTDAAYNMDQCRNGAPLSPTQCNTAAEWVNGNLGSSNSHYGEGDSVPYRLKMQGLTLASHTVTLEWDTTESGKHAIDYLTTYNASETLADPCAGITCAAPTTFAIPQDPAVPFLQDPGVFTMYGGTITSVSAYQLSGTYAGTSQTQIQITFTAAVADPVLAWGGHIATRQDWGPTSSAAALSGSPYHMRTLDLDGSGGNQDRSLSAAAVILPGQITITKQATPEGPTSFPFTASPAPLANFSLVDDGTATNTQVFSGITNFQTYTVSEGPIPAGWALTNVTCTHLDGFTGLPESSTTINGATATINLSEGDTVSCTYNDVREASLTIVKQADPEGSTSFDFDATGTGVSTDIDLVDDGTAANTQTFTLDANELGTKTVVENVPAGWSLTGRDCTGTTETLITNGVSIDVQAGDNIVCTFNDVQDASLTIVKQADPEGSTSFDFDATGTGVPTDIDLVDDGTAANTQTFTFDPTELGTKTVVENVPAGWSLTSASCDNSGTSIANGVSIDVDAGDNITCTFNDVQDASLTIVKQADPEGATSFDFDATGTGVPTDIDLVDDGTAANTQTFTLDASELGTKTVVENVPAGWSLTSASCDNSGAPIANGVSIDVDAGDNITCTFNDVQDASLTIVKQADPEGATSFDFDATGTGVPTDIDLVDDGTAANTQTFTLDANELGTKTVVENIPAGWSLTSASCDNSGTSIANGVSIDVDAGDNITCTFNDVQDASLTIVKQADPEGSTSFDFDATGTGIPTDIDLVDDGTAANTQTITLDASELGTKTVVENVPAGWNLTSASCNNSGTPIANGVSIDVDAGDNITCTFNNTQDATLTIVKQADPEGPTSFDFDATGTGIPTDIDLVDDGTAANTQTFTLDANELGTKTVVENVPAGWSLTSASCNNSGTPIANGVSIDVDAGDNITCTFNNVQDASLTIVKQADPEGATSFDFDATGTGVPTDIDLVDDGTAANTQSFTLDSTELGTKTVVENVPAGWSLTSASCNNSGTSIANGVSIDVDAGDNITCTFNDVQDASLTIVKQADPEGSTSFDFDATGTGVPTDIDLVDDGTAANTQSFTLDANELGTKTVVENVPAGWQLMSASCNNSGAPIANGVSIDVDAGDNITCTFNNRQNTTATVVKLTLPAGVDQDFQFTVTGTLANEIGPSVTLNDASDATDSTTAVVEPGTFTVTETVPTGWRLEDIVCTGATVTDIPNGVSVTASPGQNVSCEFVNLQLSHVTVIKQTVPDADATAFAFASSGPGAAELGAFQLTDGQSHSAYVTPGALTVDENVPGGWNIGSIACTGDAGAGAPDLAAGSIVVDADGGEEIVCTFTNVRAGAIAIDKNLRVGDGVYVQGPVDAVVGSTLGYRFTITNPGPVALTQVTLSDPRCEAGTLAGPVKTAGDADDELEPGETWVYTCSRKLVAADPSPFENTATVNAVDPAGKPVSASDNAVANILPPQVAIDKTGPASGTVGDRFTYGMVVTNPGPVALIGETLAVSDPLCEAPPQLVTKGTDQTPNTLDPGDSWVYACTVQSQPGQTRIDNVATVTGTDGRTTVSASDNQLTTLAARAILPETVTPVLERATLSMRSGCRPKAFTVTVNGTGIAQVSFYVDGKLLRRMPASRARVVRKSQAGRTQQFRITINPKRYSEGTHRVEARVRFVPNARRRTRKLVAAFQRCEQQVAPRFTG